MLPLLIFALIGITTSVNVIQEQAFRSGREYVYNYDSQILTGLPKHSSIHSGYRLSAQVRLQFISDIDVRVQFENLNLYNVRQPITQMEAHENLIPKEFLKEMVGPESKTITRILMIPFGFSYKAGQVYKIALSNNETDWSANAKRGFMSLFEMNLNKRMLLAETVQGSNIEVKSPVNSYKVLEHSAAGSCATWYNVEEVVGNDTRLYSTKVRDYTQCIDRPEYFKTMYDGFFPIGHIKDNPLTTGAIVKHAMKGSAAKFIILSAVAQSKIAFSPYWNKGTITTTVNQTLELTEARSIPKSSFIPEVPSGKVTSLQMTIASKAVDTLDPFSPTTGQSMQEPKQDNLYSVDTILSQLRQAAENMLEVTSRESMVYLGVVTEMLSSAPRLVIKDVWGQLTVSKVKAVSEVDKLASKILFDVLPHVGTEAAANFVLDVCTENFITNDCAAAFNILTLKATPTLALINKLTKFLSSSKDMPAMVRQTAYLTLGSMGYKLSRAKSSQLKELDKVSHILQVLERDVSESSQQLVKTRKQKMDMRRKAVIGGHTRIGRAIVEEIEKLIESGTTPEKMLGLKALGNSGLPQAVPALQKVIADRDQPLFLRILGVLGHRRMYFDRQVRRDALKTLLRIYQDTTETNELRNFAFIVLMQLHPELPVIEKIASSLHNEKDAHVSSLVHSYLGGHANTTFYPFTSFVKNCSDALKFAPKTLFHKGHSFTKMFTKIYDGYKIGKVLSLTSIGSVSRFVGKAVTLDTYIYGMYSNFMEVGINSMNINQFFNKLFGPNGLFTMNKSLFDVLKRETRDINPKQMIQDIFQKLQIKPRATGVPASHVYVKFMGHELRYYDVTEYIRAITAEGKAPLIFDPIKLSAGLPLDIKGMMYLMNTRLTLPTEAGFPVSLKFKVSKALNVQGSLKFKVMPHMLEVDRMGSPPVKINAELDIKPKAIMEVYGSMGLDAHFIKRTVSVRGLLEYDMPIKKEFSYDIMKKKFKLVGHLPELDKPLMKMMFQPYAESVTLSSRNKSAMLKVDLLPLSSHGVIPVDHFYELKCLGYKIGFRGQLPECSSWQQPLCLMAGKTHISFLKLPTQDTPQVVTIQGQIISPSETPDVISGGMTNQDINDSGVKNPLPETLPYNDPVDLSNTTVNMRQLVAKFEELTGQVIPYGNKPEARGIILTLDASTESTTRKSQIEILSGNLNSGQINSAFFRLWKSPVQAESTNEWQSIAEMRVTYPLEIHKPEDIFSKTWQQQVMKELEYHVSTGTHKASNYILKSKLMSELNQLKYPAMTRTPTFRILSNLIPEQLYKVSNVSEATTLNPRNWIKFWAKILPLQEKVLNEKQQVVNPLFIKRDANILCYLEEITRVQTMLITDLSEIEKLTVVPHGELPIAQWMVFNHATVVNFLDEIITKYTATGTISKVKTIQDQLTVARQNMDTIVKKMTKIISSVTVVTDDLASHGRPNTDDQANGQRDVTDSFQAPVDYQGYIPGQQIAIESPNDDKVSQSDPDYPNLRDLGRSLNQLATSQGEVIDQIQESLGQTKGLNPELIQKLIGSTQENLIQFDEIWKSCSIYDNTIIEKMLLVTVQNEFIIHMLTVHRKWDNRPEKMLNVDKQITEVLETFYVKIASSYLGQRVSSLFKQKLLHEVVTPNLNQNELQIYEDLKNVYRIMAVNRREFETNFVYNKSSRHDVLQSGREMEKLFGDLDSNINKVRDLQKAVADLETAPKLYLVSDLLGIIRLLKTNVDFGRQSLMPMSFSVKNTWIKKLEEKATSVQRLVSSMSQIFGKFVLGDVKEKTDAVTSHPDGDILQQSQLQPLKAWSHLPPSITGSLNITWGPSGTLDRSIKIQTIATRSLEQLFYLYKQMDSMVRGTEIENGINSRLSSEIWETDGVMTKMNSYNHLHIAAFYDKTSLPPWMVRAGYSLHDYIRYYLWDSYSRHQALTSMESGHTEVIMDLSDINKKWDMYVMTNTDTDKFLDVPLSTYTMAFKPNNNYKSVKSRIMTYLSTDFLPGQCTVYNDKLRTFDQVTYQLPASLALCTTVLAMDCTQEKSFAVTVMRSNSSYLGHVVKIFYEDKLLEISPGYLDIEVKENNEMLALTEGNPITYSRLLQYKLYQTFMKLSRQSLRVSIELPLAGVTVDVEGSHIIVKVQPLFQKRLCGLCGNFDQQISWEYEGPQHELYATAKWFAYSYALPDRRCPVHNDMRLKSDLQQIVINKQTAGNDPRGYKAKNGSTVTNREHITEDKCLPVKSFIVQYRQKKSQTCFPESHFFRCPSGCTGQRSEQKKMKHLCLPSDHPQVPQLKSDIQQGIFKSFSQMPEGEIVIRYVPNEPLCRPSV